MIKPSQPPWRASEMHFPPPFGAVRHQRGESHRRWLITVVLIMPCDTESKSHNVLASPLGEEGHEVAKGVQANWIHRGAPRPANPVRRHPAKSVCTRVRMIMILLFYFLSPFAQGAADWRSGPRWSIILVLCPVHPFATTWHFPSRGNEKIGGTGYCVTYDTESQSRNADFILIALRAIPQPSA